MQHSAKPLLPVGLLVLLGCSDELCSLIAYTGATLTVRDAETHEGLAFIATAVVFNDEA